MDKLFILMLLSLSLTGCGAKWFPMDETPDPFTFAVQTAITMNTTVESNTVTISGIDDSASLRISGGEYSINGGAYASNDREIHKGNTLKVRHTSSPLPGTDVTTTVRVGAFSTSFTSTTEAADGTPNTFAFTSPTVPISTTFGTYSSNAVTISAINVPSVFTFTGKGFIKIDGNEPSPGTNTINNNSKVRIFHNFTTAGRYVSRFAVGSVFSSFSTTRVP